MADNIAGNTFIELTAEIVSAYVSNNSVAAADLAGLINQVHAALSRVSTGQIEQPSASALRTERNSNRSSAICERSTI
jgi:predicted transcriptional regulator